MRACLLNFAPTCRAPPRGLLADQGVIRVNRLRPCAHAFRFEALDPHERELRSTKLTEYQ